eukprot:6203438-Pleurochrysis_carterae.AAC.2
MATLYVMRSAVTNVYNDIYQCYGPVLGPNDHTKNSRDSCAAGCKNSDVLPFITPKMTSLLSIPCNSARPPTEPESVLIRSTCHIVALTPHFDKATLTCP